MVTTLLETRPDTRPTAARPAGRPRYTGLPAGEVPAREQILEVSARLFTSQGFTATSTREISDVVGIRQASLYYHFATKDQILAELLKRSLRPTLDLVETVERICAGDSPATALCVLALVDVATLNDAPHNAGMLAGLPDVRRSPCFADYCAIRGELVAAYDRLAEKVADGRIVIEASLGEMLAQMVEVVISVRRRGDVVDEEYGALIAASCLRMCGLDEDSISAAASTAAERFRLVREL